MRGWWNESASISLEVEGKKDMNFCWDEGCEVEELFLGSKESNEEEWDLGVDDWSFLALEEEVYFLFFSRDKIEALR